MILQKNEFFKTVKDLGFLRYSDPSLESELLEVLYINVFRDKVFTFRKRNQTAESKILFSFDGEELAEGGGMDLFEDLKETLIAAGLEFNSSFQVFKNSGKRTLYYFYLNDSRCNLSIKSFMPFALWTKVARKYFSFLNRELKRQNCDIRIYLMNNKSCDTEIALLTKEQIEFINSLGLIVSDRAYKLTRRKARQIIFEPYLILLKALFTKSKTSA